MTDYEISKQYENWLVPPEWAYDIAGAVVGFIIAWVAGLMVASFVWEALR